MRHLSIDRLKQVIAGRKRCSTCTRNESGRNKWDYLLYPPVIRPPVYVD